MKADGENVEAAKEAFNEAAVWSENERESVRRLGNDSWLSLVHSPIPNIEHATVYDQHYDSADAEYGELRIGKWELASIVPRNRVPSLISVARVAKEERSCGVIFIPWIETYSSVKRFIFK